jgi:hypothetical protein
MKLPHLLQKKAGRSDGSFFIVVLLATTFCLQCRISAQTNLLLASTGNKFNFYQSSKSYSQLIPPDSSNKNDSLSNFDSFNKTMEKLFIYIPVPLYSYSSEAGHTFGLAKFNVINLYKKDTITKPSKISEVFTISTEGRINASIATELVFRNNQYIILSYINYKKTPEYIFGIGNDVKKEDVEEIKTDRIKFYTVGLYQVAKDFYAGAGIDLANYFSVQTSDTSFLVKNNVSGLDGGADIGLGLAAAWDTRDNRYNAHRGHYILTTLFFYPEFLGSAYQFTGFELDARKFFTPWLNHVIAIQGTTTFTNRDVPFYDLALMGGENKMRGYYKGALRDNVLVDAQLEYRMPVWNIFGVTGWVGTGRVAPDYGSLSLDGLWLSYGAGLRIKVDSAHDTNLRFDFGFGPGGINGFYINFAEAF